MHWFTAIIIEAHVSLLCVLQIPITRLQHSRLLSLQRHKQKERKSDRIEQEKDRSKEVVSLSNRQQFNALLFVFLSFSHFYLSFL